MSRFPFDDLPGEERNLDEIVRRAAQKPLPKRFYKTAAAVEAEGGFALQLDGRAARTPARHILVLPTPTFAAHVVAEWNGQKEHIDPNMMPFTRIANSAIDGVTTKRGEVLDDLVRYAGTDMIFYRAEGPERLVAEQQRDWDPILDWARVVLDAPFVCTAGVMHREQPPAAVAAVRTIIEKTLSPFALAALHVMTTLSGSVLIPLAYVHGLIGAEAAWAAAHVDELFQESIWGIDEEATQRRVARRRDFMAASEIFLSL